MPRRKSDIIVAIMPKKPVTPPEAQENVLVTAAKAIGSTAGKIAALAGAPAAAPPATKSAKIGKLVKKERGRIPRRQKKAQRKTPAAQA